MVEFYREYYTAKNELPQLLTVLAQAQKTEGDVERRVAMGMEMARAAETRPAARREGDRDLEGDPAPQAAPARGGDVAARASTPGPRSGTRCSSCLKDDLDAVPADDVDEKINRYLEIVAIYRDRLNLDVMVVNTYLNILALKPDHPAALAALAVALRGAGALRRSRAGADPPGRGGRRTRRERVALHRRIAALWADKLGKHGNAIASFEKIFESDPTDGETSARLKDLYTKGRAWRPLHRGLPARAAAPGRRPRAARA